MQYIGTVQVLTSSKDLVNEELAMLVSETLGTLNDRSQVSLHQFIHYVEVIELLSTRWKQNCVYSNYVFMFQ